MILANLLNSTNAFTLNETILMVALVAITTWGIVFHLFYRNKKQET